MQLDIKLFSFDLQAPPLRLTLCGHMQRGVNWISNRIATRNRQMRQRGNWQQAALAPGAGDEAAASWPASAIATIFLANLAMT